MFSISTWRARIRRWSRAAYRELRHPRKLKLSAWRRWLGRFALDRRLWRHEKHNTSLGFACGAFISPFVILGQTPLSMLLACFFRCNVPAAVLGSWIGSPVTFPFFIVLEAKIGEMIWPIENFSLSNPGIWKHGDVWWRVYLGAPIVGLALAALCYFLLFTIFLTWEKFAAKKFPVTTPPPTRKAE